MLTILTLTLSIACNSVVDAVERLIGMRVTAPAPAVAVGESVQMSAKGVTDKGTETNNVAPTWRSSNPGTATVTPAGMVTGVAVGSAWIAAIQGDFADSMRMDVLAAEPPLTVGFNNQPAGMTVLSDADLNSLSGPWTYTPNTATASTVTDPTSPVGNPVFQFDFPQSFAGGHAPAKLSPPGFPDATGSHNYKELYYGFYWKADTAWQNHSSNINKVAFGWTNNASTFYLVWHWWDGRTTYRVPPRSLLVNGFGSVVNDFIIPNQPGLFSLQPGKWYKIEWYVKLATSSTSNDGIVRIWVNDRLMMNYTDRSRTGYISDTYFDPVWGGTGDSKQHTDFMRISHARVSVR